MFAVASLTGFAANPAVAQVDDSRYIVCVATRDGATASAVRPDAGAGVRLNELGARDGCFSIRVEGASDAVITWRAVGYVPRRTAVAALTPGPDTTFLTLDPLITTIGRLIVSANADSGDAILRREALRAVPALGETDALRALPVLPAVSQPNDIVGRYHLVGGAGDEHALTLDGFPMQAPMRLSNVLSAFDPAALDALVLRLHERAIGAPDRVGGEIALSSRRATDQTELEGRLGVLSGSAALAVPVEAMRGEVVATVRQSFWNQLLDRFGSPDGSDDYFLSDFTDGLVRLRARPTPTTRVGALFFGTIERFPGSRAVGARPRFGEQLLGVDAGIRVRGWDVNARLSESAFRVTGFDAGEADPRFVDEIGRSIELQQDWRSLALNAVRGGADERLRLSVGARLDARHHQHDWRSFTPNDDLLEALPRIGAYTARQQLAAFDGEASLRISPRTRFAIGTRVVSAGRGANVGPTFGVSVDAHRALGLQARYERRFQFDASGAEPIEGAVPTPTFLFDRPLIADVGSVRATWRPARRINGGRVALSASAYTRSIRNRPVLVGALQADGIPPSFVEDPLRDSLRFVRVNGDVVGATLGVHLAAERLLVQGALTLQRSRDDRFGSPLPVPWDAPVQASMLLSLPLGEAWEVGLAGQWNSGPAVTPIGGTWIGILPGGRFAPGFLPADPLSARAPSYRRLDLSASRRWRALGSDWRVSAQVLNVLSRRNGLGWTGSALNACRNDPSAATSFLCRNDGAARASLPIVPSVSIEVRR